MITADNGTYLSPLKKEKPKLVLYLGKADVRDQLVSTFKYPIDMGLIFKTAFNYYRDNTKVVVPSCATGSALFLSSIGFKEFKNEIIYSPQDLLNIGVRVNETSRRKYGCTS